MAEYGGTGQFKNETKVFGWNAGEMVYLFSVTLYTGIKTLFHSFEKMKLVRTEESFSLVIMIELIGLLFVSSPSDPEAFIWFFEQINEIKGLKWTSSLQVYKLNGWKWFSDVDWKFQAFKTRSFPTLVGK